MRKIEMTIPFILSLSLLASCAQAEGNTGSDSFANAAADVMVDSTVDEPGTDSPDSKQSDDHSEAQGEFPQGGLSADILAAYADTTIAQTIEGTDGRIISINAEVDVEGISRVNCYRYVPQPITDEFREDLFASVFRAETWDANVAAVYNEEKDVWELATPLGTEWEYKVIGSDRDKTDLEEQVFELRNIHKDFDISRDKRLPVVPMEQMVFDWGITMDEGEQMFEWLLGFFVDEEEYSLNYTHAYGTDSSLSHIEMVYKRTIDGMPVTAYHNLCTIWDAWNDNSIFERIWGTRFGTEEIGLGGTILMVEEAVAALQAGVDAINLDGEKHFAVTKISLEYLVVPSSDAGFLITPIWRFWLGKDEDEMNYAAEKILAVDAVTGELVWEER